MIFLKNWKGVLLGACVGGLAAPSPPQQSPPGVLQNLKEIYDPKRNVHSSVEHGNKEMFPHELS